MYRTILSVLIAAAATAIVTAQKPWTGSVSKAEEASLFAPPPLRAADGFSATLVVPPGKLFDPLSILPRPDGSLWIVDDGGIAPMDHGGYIWAIDRHGKVSTAVDAKRMMPAIGFDIAPTSFGKWGGQILLLATATAEREGVRESHIIQSLDITSRGTSSKTICTLQNNGTANGGVPAGGIEARFGPPGTPFANRFFAITITNNTIYQTTADGGCRPFVTFQDTPWGLAFSRDGLRMLVTLRQGVLGGREPANARSSIVTVDAKGAIDPRPLYQHSTNGLFDVEIAPDRFPTYGGQVFFTDWGPRGTAGSIAPPVWDGAVYRIGPDGQAHVVVSGLSHPSAITFVGRTIWISDINRDGPFLRDQWVPDGFLARADLRESKK